MPLLWMDIGICLYTFANKDCLGCYILFIIMFIWFIC